MDQFKELRYLKEHLTPTTTTSPQFAVSDYAIHKTEDQLVKASYDGCIAVKCIMNDRPGVTGRLLVESHVGRGIVTPQGDTTRNALNSPRNCRITQKLGLSIFPTVVETISTAMFLRNGAAIVSIFHQIHLKTFPVSFKFTYILNGL